MGAVEGMLNLASEIINMIISKLPSDKVPQKSDSKPSTAKDTQQTSKAPEIIKTADPKPSSDTDVVKQTLPFDMDSLLNRCMGNQRFLEKILNKFEIKAVEYLKDIEDCVEAGDAEQVGRLAHSFKGAAANLSAETLRQIAFEIEQLGKSGDLTNVGESLEKLKNEINRCLEYLPNMVV